VVDVSNNPFIGIDGTWSFTTVLAIPIPHSGGPYLVPVGGSLALNGSASNPSTGATISPTGYSWDLNRDNVYGDVTEANPPSITDAVLMGTYGMVLGQNTLKLRITDSQGNTAIATTIVKIGVNLNWDANGTSSGQTDGTGLWLDANRWRDNGLNTSWVPGSTPIFGVNGDGGTVTLGGNTTVGSLIFNSFNGTNFIRSLGSGIGQMQLTGGESGFGCNGATGLSVIFGNSAANEAVWGTAIFNPSALVLQAASARMPLRWASLPPSPASSAGNPAGLTKTGTGLITLSAANTYNGGTTVQSGSPA